MSDIAFGLWMTALGMGSVFLLLILLMIVLKAIGWADQRTQRRAAAAAPAAAEDAAAEECPQELSEDEIAAVSLAVITHARIRRLQAAPAMRAHEPGSQLFASRWVSIGRGYQIQPWRRGT